MKNPTIEELNDETRFQKIAQLSHNNIKEFVLEQLGKGGLLVRAFMFYQIVMLIVGVFFVTRATVLHFRGNTEPLYYSLAALVFCFSVLIVVHELLHGAAIKITGAPKVNYGGYLRKFIFYAEADNYVINRRQFAFIALTPLVVVQVLTAVLCFIFSQHPAFYFVVFVMSAHSMFCAGDIGLLSIFYAEKEADIYTYDVKAIKTSYYFKRLK